MKKIYKVDETISHSDFLSNFLDIIMVNHIYDKLYVSSVYNYAISVFKKI